MSHYVLKEKQELAGKIVRDLQAMGVKRAEENRAYTSEERETMDKMFANEATLREEIDTIQRDMKLSAIASDTADIKKESQWSKGSASRQFTEQDKNNALKGWMFEGDPKNQSSVYQEAAQRCGIDLNSKAVRIRFGQSKDGSPELCTFGTNPQSSTGSGVGAELIQTDVVASISLALKQFGKVRNICYNYVSPNANPIKIPVDDDTANLATGPIAQNTANSTNLELDFTQVTLNAFKYGSRITASRQFLRDSIVDATGFIGARLGERMARKTEALYALGAGTTEPQGFVGTNTPLISGQTTAHGAQVTYVEMANMQGSVDAAYRDLPSCAWMMHDGMRTQLLTMVDDDHRPVWQANYLNGVTADPVERFLGKPVYINNSMPAPTNAGGSLSSKSVVFGAWSYFWVRLVGDVYLVRNDYIGGDSDNVVFYAWYETDSNVVAPSSTYPLKFLTCGSAS